jgi:hypothetical protein
VLAEALGAIPGEIGSPDRWRKNGGGGQASIADQPKPSLDEEPSDPLTGCAAGRGADIVTACDVSEACALGDLMELGPALFNVRFGDRGMH